MCPGRPIAGSKPAIAGEEMMENCVVRIIISDLKNKIEVWCSLVQFSGV
jgi:hypothetical protein